jgi:hypothetical protein
MEEQIPLPAGICTKRCSINPVHEETLNQPPDRSRQPMKEPVELEGSSTVLYFTIE